MKKTFFIATLAFICNLNSSEYIVQINNDNYNQAVIIEKNIPTCTGFEILNENKDACYDPAPTCVYPNVLNNERDSCVNTFEKVGWIDRTDSCQGVKQSTMNPNIYYIRANTNIRNRDIEIPEGYHWMSIEEYNSLIITTTQTVYSDQCGHSGSPIASNGFGQYYATFSNSGDMLQVNHVESRAASISYNKAYAFKSWFGIVAYKD